LHVYTSPAYSGKRNYPRYLWESGYTGSLPGSDATIAFQHTLGINPACITLGLAHSEWGSHQYIIRAAPALRYLSLHQNAGDIVQRADALRRTHEQQKRCGYRHYLAAAAAQTPHTE